MPSRSPVRALQPSSRPARAGMHVQYGQQASLIFSREMIDGRALQNETISPR